MTTVLLEKLIVAQPFKLFPTLLPFPHKLAIAPCHEPNESSPHPSTLDKVPYNITLPSTPWSSKCFLCFISEFSGNFRRNYRVKCIM